ncbi:MAG: hypothetical protein AABX39_00635 [Nanoarchaeota archaeon]
MDKQIVTKLHKSFEDCANEKDGIQFWFARDLQKLSGYVQWRNFLVAVEKAKESCANARQKVSDHFADASNMVAIGSDTERGVDENGFARIRSKGDEVLFGGYSTAKK